MVKLLASLLIGWIIWFH